MAPGDAIIDHPNRDRAESRSTKAIVVALLLISAALEFPPAVHFALKHRGDSRLGVAVQLCALLGRRADRRRPGRSSA